MAVYTAKSLIIDVTNGYGSAANVGLTQLDFMFEGAKIEMGPADYTAVATSMATAAYGPANVFNTALSKLGSTKDTGWLSAGLQITNQRISVTFTVPVIFDALILNNAAQTTISDVSSKTSKINITTEAFLSDVYEATIPQATLIFDGDFRQHVSEDIEDPETLNLLIETAVSYAFAGTVLKGGVGVIRDLELWDRSLVCELLETVTSEASTGVFAFTPFDAAPGRVYRVEMRPLDSTENGMIFDHIGE